MIYGGLAYGKLILVKRNYAAKGQVLVSVQIYFHPEKFQLLNSVSNWGLVKAAGPCKQSPAGRKCAQRPAAQLRAPSQRQRAPRGSRGEKR